MNQIALPFAWPVPDKEEDFLLSDANRTAFDHLTRWSLWPVMATLITGPRKTGRSLLGRILPMMLLMNDPLPDWEGGGGTTFLPASASL